MNKYTKLNSKITLISHQRLSKYTNLKYLQLL